MNAHLHRRLYNSLFDINLNLITRRYFPFKVMLSRTIVDKLHSRDMTYVLAIWDSSGSSEPFIAVYHFNTICGYAKLLHVYAVAMGSTSLFPFSLCIRCGQRLVLGDEVFVCGEVGTRYSAWWLNTTCTWCINTGFFLTTLASTCRGLHAGVSRREGSHSWDMGNGAWYRAWGLALHAMSAWLERAAKRSAKRRLLEITIIGKSYGARNILGDIVYRPPYAYAGIVDDREDVIQRALSYI